ncbi:heterokaryon incompatibility protein Het-C-domain-containing protein [Cyathus striatus]|nr:heterokaryon incompatibility protein Het-C-domain-containing protein [Cyathus striatus]
MSSNLTLLFILLFIFAFCLSGNGVYAFGAGNIPSFAYMEGKAFRHGDIEDILADLIKKGAGGGFALASLLSKGSKFNGLDIKRVYFGNWLRDYSQAVDIASLKKLPLQTIINLCMVLGFMAHGYATNEFEVTPERLGVYLPTEHIDNPKGYGEGEDARKYHPSLRGPVDPRELEIDPRTGMKNYIANEGANWDTSKALVRRTLERCIQFGRAQRSNGRKQDEYEAYRLLGQALHTLEDFSAHSNFCELALVSMGHNNVFVHVGDQVRIQAPNGKWVAPIVTGSFGSNDFIHSLLGEATDHLSEASVSDLNKELEKARTKSLQSNTRGPGGGPANPGDILRDLLFSLPGSDGKEMSRDMEAIERIRAGPAQGGKRPEDMSPQEMHAVLWQVLTFRDSVVKKISKTIEKIPGLGPLIEKIMDGISVFVFTTLEPFLKPLLKSASSGLQSVSGEVINSHDQYEVFNDLGPYSDPTHSFLSKDHFNLILNEPAGQLARVVVKYAVTLVIKAWDDASMNVHQITEDILQCLFHPDFHNSQSQIQREMLQCIRDWVQQLGGRQNTVIQRLGKNAVRNHENVRLGGDGGKPTAEGTFASQEAHQVQNSIAGYASSHIPGFSQAQGLFNAVNLPARDGIGGPAGGGGGYPGQGQGQGQSAPPMGGQAASYYGGASGGGGGGNSGYAPPSGPPPSHSSYQGSAGQSSYQPPSGPPGQSPYQPPSGPPVQSPYQPHSSRPSHNTSAPSYPHSPTSSEPSRPGYSPSYNSPAPSFPGSSPAFPGAEGNGGRSSPPLSFPGAGPGFPGAGGGYSSHPPSFPGGGQQPSFPGAGPGFPDSGPGFPGAPGYGPGPGYGGAPGGGPNFPGAGPGFPESGPGFPGAPGAPGAGPPYGSVDTITIPTMEGSRGILVVGGRE